MRILLLANNFVGWQIASYLAWHTDDEIVGMVVHPCDKAKYLRGIVNAAAPDACRLFEGPDLKRSDVMADIKALGADIAISAYFGYILKPDFLRLFPQGCINIHPALLPYNRGAYTNVWPIIEDTPAGVTIHYVDESVDTGDIIAQREVDVLSTDTGETLYRRLEQASIALFRDEWANIRLGNVKREKQDRKEGTHHRVKDVDAIDEIDLYRRYRAQDLINIIRARTHKQYNGAYFVDRHGDKVYLKLELSTCD